MSSAERAYAPQVRVLGKPGDRQRLRDLCPRLSAQSRYMRFHGVLNEMSEVFLDHLMDVDHNCREALVALDGDEIIGVARYAATSEVPRLAEISVLVADAWQRQGVARDLLIRLRDTALQRGILLFKASVLPTNDRAQQLLSVLAPDHLVLHQPDGLEFRWSHLEAMPFQALPSACPST